MEGQRPDGKVVRFDLLRIKRDSQLRCQCSVPRLELDPKNRTVQCKDCRALAFREMESEYRRGVLPRCPVCGKPFDPIKIKEWTNKDYV